MMGNYGLDSDRDIHGSFWVARLDHYAIGDRSTVHYRRAPSRNFPAATPSLPSPGAAPAPPRPRGAGAVVLERRKLFGSSNLRMLVRNISSLVKPPATGFHETESIHFLIVETGVLFIV